MTRWLGVDYGTRRVGVAVGDTAGAIATPLETIPAVPTQDLLRRVGELAGQYDAVGVVVGWPLNMDDTEGPQARLTRQFACELAGAVALDVRLWDERLTSQAADDKLAGHYTRKQKKARQDAVAAATIVQDFLTGGGVSSAPHPRDARAPGKAGSDGLQGNQRI